MQLTEEFSVLGKGRVVYEHLLGLRPRALEGDVRHAVQDLAQYLSRS